MLSTDTVPLTIGTTDADEATFAHAIADCLARDILNHCGLLMRLFGRKLELYVLDTGYHINSDRLHRAECRESRVDLPHDNANRRETIRRIVDSAVPAIITRHRLPFSSHSVRVVEVEAYERTATHDRYSMDFALHIVLLR
jgi:hypothetical protein